MQIMGRTRCGARTADGAEDSHRSRTAEDLDGHRAKTRCAKEPLNDAIESAGYSPRSRPSACCGQERRVTWSVAATEMRSPGARSGKTIIVHDPTTETLTGQGLQPVRDADHY